MPNVLRPRDLVSRPDNMDGTVLHTYILILSEPAVVAWTVVRPLTITCYGRT